MLSVEDIRQRFPALQRRHNGYEVAYFDGPGGTQVPMHVVEAMSAYLLDHNANTHWAYPTSEETDAILEDARRTVGLFLNAGEDEIVFGANMTTLTFHLARALGTRWGAGDRIVVTELDHHANIAPWKRLERERGVTVAAARFDPDTGQLDWDHFEQLIDHRTRLVAIGAASNALGTVNDVSRAAKAARAVGALLFVDAVHFASHELVDVEALDCDFLTCSAYKFYGPHVGILFGRHDLLQDLDVAKLDPAPNSAPRRVETGTLNHEGIAGTAAAIDFIASLAGAAVEPVSRRRLEDVFEGLHDRGAALVRRLWDGLKSVEAVTLYGPDPESRRTPTLSFSVEGMAPQNVAAALAEVGVFVSDGDFYAQTVIERLRPEGLVRAGCACYTTNEEVDRLVTAVAGLA